MTNKSVYFDYSSVSHLVDWQQVTWFLISLSVIGITIYGYIKYREVTNLEADIFELEKEWDSIPKKAMNPYMNNNQYIKSVEKKREPIERKIHLLKQARQFALDKIPLVNLLKK